MGFSMEDKTNPVIQHIHGQQGIFIIMLIQGLAAGDAAEAITPRWRDVKVW